MGLVLIRNQSQHTVCEDALLGDVEHIPRKERVFDCLRVLVGEEVNLGDAEMSVFAELSELGADLFKSGNRVHVVGPQIIH